MKIPETHKKPGEAAKYDGDAPVIRTRGLTKIHGRVVALSDLDLEVEKNSIFGFLGPNGAGKTTTMKLLLGLAHPTSGSGEVFGKDVTKEDFEIRRRVGYLAQDPQYYGHMTARETLRFAAKFFYSGPEKEIERRVDESLELVGLSDRADRRIRGFSGGERQRLGLAQAQINDPELLILDEPAASLDPMGRRDVLEIMERLRAERNTTIFYSTHILDDVQRVSDSVAILRGGRLLAQAPIERLLSADGPGTTAYRVEFKDSPTEVLDRTRERLLSQAWVSSVEAEAPVENGAAAWLVRATDEAAAEGELLRLVLEDGDVRVAGFGRKRQSLEEAFFGLVEGDEGGRDEK